MEVLIVGGGIGGLTLALAIHASGAARKIRIFEAAADIRALGIGINLAGDLRALPEGRRLSRQSNKITGVRQWQIRLRR